MTADRAPRRRRAAAVGVPVLAAGATAAALIGGYALHPRQQAAAAAAAGPSTARVVRTDLANTVQVSGALGYRGSFGVINEATGTAYTALPAAGAVIRRGKRLYEVDGAPVTLFYGARPAWRDLSEGVLPGPDVAQLDRNLIALGYGGYLTVSEYYTAATAYAVESWQQAVGLPVTGFVPLGQVAFAPGPLRITSIAPVLGSPPQPGALVLTATSTDQVVTAQLPVTQEYLARRGDQVTVTLPDGVTTAPGTITAISSVATSTSGGGGGGGGSDPSAPPGQGSGDSQETVAMTVRLTGPSAAGNFDQAPVSVNIISARASNVLAVPVSALVALAGGGYGVELVHGAGATETRQLVGVRTGLYSATLVQVFGPGLAVGDLVEVPSA
jgi:peptidoglycan hydrolase-like protein with peptidoglycan-binding domain